MRNVARNVWQLDGFPPHAINAYLVEDVLIDCGTRWMTRKLLRTLEGVDLSMVALTHCHPDHQGAAAALCAAHCVPLACHEADRDVMEGRAAMRPPSTPIRLFGGILAGPAHRVERLLKEGDEVAGFRVVEAPGHTPGHVVFFREDDRVLIAGDVLANMNFLTGRAGPREPPTCFSVDPALNRRSFLKLAELRPRTVLFGHGPPLRDGDRLREFAARLERGGGR